MRLDKFLAHTTGYSRTDVKKFLKKKEVQVDGEVVTSASFQVDLESHQVTLLEEELFYQKYVYLMMNKPAGYLSATKDGQQETVMAFVEDYYLRFDPQIAGRLDKDTEGLLLLTNDGQFLHDVITPKKKIYKRYLVHFEGQLSLEAVTELEAGVTIKDGKGVEFVTAPAKVKLLAEHEAEIAITEGKFHQVKRMFASVGCPVIYLKRLAIGGLELDPYLELGEFRELEEMELDAIRDHI